MSGTDCALGLFCSIKVEFRGWKQQRTEDEKIPFNASLCNSTSRTESQVAKSLFRKTTGRRRRHRRDVTLSRAAREGVRGGLINTNFQGWMCLSWPLPHAEVTLPERLRRYLRRLKEPVLFHYYILFFFTELFHSCIIQQIPAGGRPSFLAKGSSFIMPYQEYWHAVPSLFKE